MLESRMMRSPSRVGASTEGILSQTSVILFVILAITALVAFAGIKLSRHFYLLPWIVICGVLVVYQTVVTILYFYAMTDSIALGDPKLFLVLYFITIIINVLSFLSGIIEFRKISLDVATTPLIDNNNRPPTHRQRIEIPALSIRTVSGCSSFLVPTDVVLTPPPYSSVTLREEQNKPPPYHVIQSPPPSYRSRTEEVPRPSWEIFNTYDDVTTSA